jgi:predicted nucleic acid-binding protein
MIVVSDTSPLNYLVLIQAEHVLPEVFGQVLIPPTVYSELQRAGTPDAVRVWAANPPPWLVIRKPATLDTSLDLDPGETEAISLATEVHADQLLVDDRKAREVACRLGVATTGTLGVLAVAASRGLLSFREAIECLRRTNFRISEQVVGQIIARFDPNKPGQQ